MVDDFSSFVEPIFYVTPDPLRGIGLEKVLPDYHLVCLDDSLLVDLLIQKGIKVFSLEKTLGGKNAVYRNTGKILEHPVVQEYIQRHSQGRQANILYFKPSVKIDLICRKNGWQLLGNSENLNQQFEDKVAFYQMCRTAGLPVPPGEIKLLRDCLYQELASRYGERLVVQFGRGWAGRTTYFIDGEQGLAALQKNFPQKEVRITTFIQGKTVLNNDCVTQKEILFSPPAIQITAPEGFTTKIGGTCGRQWPAGINPQVQSQIDQYTRIVGKMMRQAGYRGFFGLDFLVESKTNKVYLSENNARLTASVPLYTKMELQKGETPLLLFHLAEFLGKELETVRGHLGSIHGAELIIRNNQSNPVEIQKTFPMGIYTLKEENLVFARIGYSFEDINDNNEFLIIAAEKGRIITPENEIARLYSRQEITDSQGEVKEWAKKALLFVKEALELK